MKMKIHYTAICEFCRIKPRKAMSQWNKRGTIQIVYANVDFPVWRKTNKTGASSILHFIRKILADY